MTALWRVRNGEHEIVVADLNALRELIRPGTLTLRSQVYSPVAEGWYPAKHIHEVNTRIERANQLRSRSRAATILVVICFLLMLYALSVVVRQGYSFLKEGTWPSMSLYDGIAQTLSPEAARILGWPQLSAMYSLRDAAGDKSKLDPVTAAGLRTIYSTTGSSSPEISGFRLWVVAPQSWFGVHKLVIPVLRAISWPFFILLLVFCFGYVAAKITPSWNDWNEVESAQSRLTILTS